MKNTLIVPLALLLMFTQHSLMAQQITKAKVEALLKKMTLEEKIGQMNQYNGFWNVTGPAPAEGDAKNKYDHLRSGQVGSMLNVVGAEQTREMQKLAVENSRLGIPLIFGFDVIHGMKTLAPIPLAESASWDLEAIEKSARMAATEAAAMGIHWTFAPMVDISRDARWGRVMEGAGEDPYLGSKIAAARVNGFQGDDLSATNTLAATAKHFAGYGFAEAGRDYNTVDVGTNTLYNVIFPPFRAAIGANVRTVMNGFNVLNGVPATGNAFLQRNILKQKWNFDGFVISDWGSAYEMIDHGFSEDLKHAAKQAALAGSDMDMESYAYVKHLKSLVESGEVPMTVIDEAVSRILTVKYELGLFDDPYKYSDAQREKRELANPALREAALDIAKKSIVLLKNEGGLLPLKKNQNVAIIGALAADKTSALGSWRIAAEDGTAVSVVEGMQALSSSVTYTEGAKVYYGSPNFIQEVDVNEADMTGFAAALTAAKTADVVVMVLGEHGFMSGEGRSRTELGLPGVQQQLLEAVAEVNSNVVLVVQSGRPLVLNWAAENVPAIVQAWQLGTENGNAVAQVLYGEHNPGGKLPMSFPRSVGQLPLYYNYLNTGRPGPKAEVFWSHYIDADNTPLYPFGYGLSYTTFAYSDLTARVGAGKTVTVRVKVKNTGSREGAEVVQLYLHDEVASVVRPVKELKGFERVVLQPGEEREVTFKLTADELGFYDREGNFVVEPGSFSVMVGSNSASGLSAEFKVR